MEGQPQALADVFCKVRVPGSTEYYIIKKQEGTNNCAFLTYGNKCKLQDTKPLDCQSYPVKIRLNYLNRIEFVIDLNCPAAENLTPKFIKKAQETALKLLMQFSNQTYQHWLDNHVGWVKKAVKLEEFLERRTT